MTKNAPSFLDDSPIDAVVTWVDGADPRHRERRESALEQCGDEATRRHHLPAAVESIRFSNNGEIKWCLYSIRKHMPWVRNIYLVTDDQEPAFLTQAVKDELGVIVIDHKIIFRGYEEYLPCFNPYAIESLLWRIPRLSDRFVFLNDDFVVIQPTGVDDFFKGESLVLRGRWERVRSRSQISLKLNSIANFALKRLWGVSRTMQLYSQMNAAEMGGFTDRYYRSPHVPHPMKKEIFREYFEQNEAILRKNLSNQFREVDNFVAASLADHLEIKRGGVIFSDYTESGMVSGESFFGVPAERLEKDILTAGERFVCIQSFECFSVERQELIARKLDQLLQIGPSYPPRSREGLA